MKAPLVRSSATAINLGLAVLATLVSLAAVELYFRATYAGLASFEGDFPPGRFPRLNADGLRDVDYGRKMPGSYRILLLGDSFTFGSGVEDDEAIWPAIIEKRLGETRPLPNVSTYQVLNAGIAGSLTDKWVGVYRYLRQEFQPDLVLVVFFLRDGTNFEQGMLDRMRPEIERLERDPFGKISTTYRYFMDKRWQRVLGQTLEQFFLDSYVGNEWDQAEWRRAQDNLLTISAIARADGSRFGVATFPLLHELEVEPYPFQPAMDEIERFCRVNTMPHMSLLPAFRGRRSASLWVSEANQHPNAEGHAIAAKAVFDFVRQLMENP